MPDWLNSELIEELFQTYRGMMFKIAMSILHNESDAEDAIQDAFLWVINNFSKISQIPCYERQFYFVNITKHKSIDIWRKRKRHPVEDIDEHFEIEGENSTEESAFSNITVEQIKDALSEMSDSDYDLLYLYLFEEKSPKEISQIFGISGKTVRVYIQRAKERLAEILRKRGI